MELDIQLLFQTKGLCHFKDSVPFIAYNKHNWSEIAAFCAPFTIQRTKKARITDGLLLIYQQEMKHLNTE